MIKGNFKKKKKKVQARAIHSYHARNYDELELQEDDVILLLDGYQPENDWLRAEFDQRQGLVPSNYVEPIASFKGSPKSSVTLRSYLMTNNDSLLSESRSSL